MTVRPASVPPPCAGEPERWFDASNTTHALCGCLACPQRSWCAAEALRVRASFGMWGGVFIKDNITEVAELLASITRMPARAELPPRPVAVPAAGADHRVAPPAERHYNVLAVVMARCSGHCELMTPQCRLTFDTLGSRIPGRDPRTLRHPGEIYAVCRPCAAAVATAEPQFTRRLGIIVDPPYEPTYTRFFWRQKQWVYLNEDSRICAADTATVQAAL